MSPARIGRRLFPKYLSIIAAKRTSEFLQCVQNDRRRVEGDSLRDGTDGSGSITVVSNRPGPDVRERVSYFLMRSVRRTKGRNICHQPVIGWILVYLTPLRGEG